jgi:3-hydroxy-9,10-secoandrosta-1,3,5(10)-triene-9,17-dione monooxygenase reductase component
VTGSPVLLGTVAHLDCEVGQLHEAGDHAIVVGAVVAAACTPHAAPLVAHRREFRALADVSEPRSAALTLVRQPGARP